MAVEAQAGNVVLVKVFAAGELQDRSGAQAPRPSGIERRFGREQERRREAARNPGSIADAPCPHVDEAVAPEKVGVGLKQFREAFFEHAGDFRIVLAAESLAPDGAVDHKKTDRVVVVALLQVPAVACMVRGDPHQVALQQIVVDGVAMLLEERERANIEEPPVVLRGAVMRPLGDGDGHFIALLLRQMRPQHIGHQQQRLRQSAELARELIGRVGQILGQRQTVHVSWRQRVVEMMAIVIAKLDVADRDFGIDVDQRRRKVESPLQCFELVRANAPVRIIRLRIGFAGHQGKNNRLVKRLHVPECPAEDILSTLDIVLPAHPVIGLRSRSGLLTTKASCVRFGWVAMAELFIFCLYLELYQTPHSELI